MKVNQGIIGDSVNQVTINKPMMEVLNCEVQKPVTQGDLVVDNGTVATGVVIMPSGQPRVVMILTHPDGTALTAVLASGAAVNELASMLFDARAAAQRAVAEIGKVTKQ